MTGLDLSLYLNISLYAILGMGALIGFMRGFKKSLFSFITTLIFYVVFFLTVNLAVTYLWSLSIPQLGQLFGLISPELSSATSFSEAAPLALDFFLGEQYASVVANEHFIELAQGIGIFALKLIYTILYFTLIFVIYKLICLIIRSIFFGGSKSNDKYVSKNRGFGLVVGILEGAIGLYVTLIIFGGIMSIAESLVTLAPTENAEEVELAFPREHLYEASYTLLAAPVIPEIPTEISAMVEELKSFTEAYNSNLLVSFTNQLTMKDDNENDIPLNIYLFDEVLSFDYNDNQVSIRKELSTFASIGAYVLSMEYMETNDITDITGDNIRDIFDLLSDSDLIVSIIPLGVEVGAIYLEVPLTVPTEELYAIDWEDELLQLGGIAATAFDIISLSGYFESEPNLDQIDIDSEMVTDLFDALGESQLITLAAYVAVEPLLAQAGETIQAVMTLPAGVEWEDIDWKEEFSGLGAILGEVLDSGITYSQITSGDYTVILNAVANIDFTIILQSKLVCYSLINVLSGSTGIEALNVIVVPDGITWLVYDEDGKTIIGGELKNILLAISAMTEVIGQIDFNNLSPSVLSDLTDDSIDTIFESQVLVASLSSVLLNFEMADFELIVPITAVDENFYILKDEMKSMVKAVKLLTKLPECDEETEDCSNLEPDYIANALSLNDDEIDTLIASDILKATVGNLINDMNQDPLVIPDSVLQEVEIGFPELRRGENLNVISGVEIKKVIKAIMVFEITNFEDIQLDASIIQKLESDTVPGEIDPQKLTTIFDSGVIHATISKVILDLTKEENAFISVPYFEEDDITELRYTEDENEYIIVDELKAVLTALHSLNITDFNNIETALDINAIFENSDLLLDSSILQATISEKLLEMTEYVVVPEIYFDNVDIQIEVGDAFEGTNTTYIYSDELDAIIDSLQVLGITDIDSIELDASIISNLEDTNDDDEDSITDEISDAKLTTLFSSAIIHATLSDVLLALSKEQDNFVVVPYFGLDDNNDEYPILLTYNTLDYISILELKAALKALYSLDISDFDSMEESINLTVILDNVDILLESSILHATVSKQLLDLDGDTVIIPEYSIENEAIKIETGDALLLTNNQYISKDELRSIFNALDVLQISDIGSVSLDATIIDNLADTEDDDGDTITDELSTDKLDTLFDSVIIHATLSDVLLDLSTQQDNYVVVPYFGLNDINTEYEVRLISHSIDYVSIGELTSALEALYALDITNFDTMEDAINLEVILANIDVLLDSAILHATVSKQLLDMNNDSVVIPTISLTGAPIQLETGDALELTNTSYITRTELRAIFNALDVLNISDITSVAFDATIINNLEDTLDDDEDDITAELSQDKLDTLFASAIIHATISDMLIDLESGDDPYVVVPDYGLDDLNNEITITAFAHGINYVHVFELENVLRALYALDVDNFDNMESTLTLDKLITHIDVLLDSSILHATVSKTLLDMDGDTVQIPYNDWDNNQIVIGTGDVLELTNTSYIIRDELENVFDALDALDINDVGSFGGNVNLALLEEEENRITVLSSVIIQATITDQIVEQETAGQLEVPYVKDDDTTILRKYVGPLTHQTELIKYSELKAILDALMILDITDVSTFEGEVDLAVISEDNNASTILLSSIIQATVTKQVTDLAAEGTVTIPKYMDDDSTLIVNTVGEIGQETDYISATELEFIFDALHILGFDDVNGFEGDVNLGVLAVGDNAEKVFSSAIVQATVSKQLIDRETDGAVTVPYVDETEMINIKIITGSGLDEFTYISKSELEAVVFALDILKITDVTTYDGTVNLTDFYEVENRNILLASSIMQATISKQLFDRGAEVLTIPYIAEDDETVIRIMAGAVGYQTEYVAQSEIHAIFEALELLNITNISSFSGSISLEKFFDQPGQDKTLNRNTLLSSASMHATISKQLIDLTDDDTLVVPDQSQAGGIIRISIGDVGFETEFVVKTEIIAMLDALETLGITNINSFNGTIDLEKIYGNTNQTIILSSASMHATITKQINDVNDDNLVVPNFDVNGDTISSTVAGTFFLNKDEIKGIINAMEILGVDDITGFTGSIGLSNLFASENANYANNQTILLSSASIHATVSKQINDLGPLVLIVPDTDVDNNLIKDSNFGTLYIYKDEIKALINALDFLGVSDITSFEGEISLVSFFASSSPETYDDNQTILLSSASMHATISKQMLDLGTAKLVVPYEDINTNEIRITVLTTEFIAKGEIKSLINALDILGINDISTFDGDVMLTQFFKSMTVEYDTNQNILLTSASLHATISKQMLDLGTTKLVVPNQDIDTNSIRSTVLTTEFIVKGEIKALINALDILGVSDITTFNGTVQLGQFFESVTLDYDGNQNILLTSASMHATISKQMLDLGTAKLVVPYEDIDTNEIRITVLATEFIAKGEIKSLINALDILGVSDITTFNGTVQLGQFFESVTVDYDGNQNILLTSASMHATISKQMLDLGSSKLSVPQKDIDSNDIRVTVLATEFIAKGEIKSLINALDILGVTDITSISGNFDLTDISSSDNQNILLTSASMHATVSEKLFSQPDDVLIIPSYSPLGETDINRIKKTVSATDFVVKDEIKALINAFIEMGFLDLESFGTSIDSSKFFSNPDVILLSASIQATFSQKMLTGTNGELIVPNTDFVTSEVIRIVHSDVTYIEIDEMKAIINALELLGLTNFTTMDFTPAKIFSADFDELLTSVSMQATISANILSGALDDSAPTGSSSLIVPNYFRQDILIGLNSEEQIEKAELKKLLTSLNTLGISDFGGAVNTTIVTTMTDANLIIMLNSGSMHITMNNMLLGNPNILVPNKAYVGGNPVTTLYDIAGVILADEIRYFILAANAIGGSDFTSIDFDYTILNSLTPENQTIVLRSMIVRNMITPDLETAVANYNLMPAMFGGPDPKLYDPIPDNFYEDSDHSTFLTAAAILTLIDYLPL